MYVFRLLILFLSFFTLLYAYEPKNPPIAQKRYTFCIDQRCASLPYNSNYSLEKKNNDITRLIVAIHSSSHNADAYFQNTLNLAHELHKENSSLIIAPQFLSRSLIDSPAQANYLYWNTYPFLGSSKAVYKNQKIQLSAFEILDTLLYEVTDRGNFSNLKDIIIFGHSAGGQFVNRYAAFSRFKKNALNVRYVVMAPSSYLYFNAQRPLGKTEHTPQKRYNSWGYGLQELYLVHKKYNVTPKTMQKQYFHSKVIYLVGSLDTNTKDTSLSKKQAAAMQGSNRVQRAQFYKEHLQQHFSKEILKRHKFFIIHGVAHTSKGLIYSQEGKKALFF
ncbi:hypothetical protein KJ691_08375 [bacterium]|nr:hypothetical protein [bacterium]